MSRYSLRVCGRRWRDEHPQAFLAASHDPTVGFEFLRFRVGDRLGALRVERDDAVGAAAQVVPGSRQLVGDANGLVLRGDLDGQAVARLSGPAFDLDLLDVLAFGARPAWPSSR